MIPSKNWEFNLEDELNRKSIESLQWLENSKEMIGKSAYYIGLKMFHSITRGLIDSEVSFAVDDLIESSAKEARSAEVWTNEKHTMILEANFEYFTYRVFSCQSKFYDSKVCDSASEMLIGMEAQRLRLEKAGFKQIRTY